MFIDEARMRERPLAPVHVRQCAGRFSKCARAVSPAAIAAGLGVLLSGCGGLMACNRVSLEESVKVPALSEVCPASRDDDLCAGLGAAYSDDGAAALQGARKARAAVRRAVGERLAAGSVEAWDPALLLYLRERILGLLAWYVAGEPAAIDPPAWPQRVATILETHFPAYAPATFPIAAVPLPPDMQPPTDCPAERDLLLFLPGVVRTLTRNEFAEQMAALQEHFPCLLQERVNTKSFADPVRNAAQAQAIIAHHPEAARIHFLGYSQGGINTLRTLIDYPDIAARTRTVMFIDAPLHGSEVGQALYDLVRPAGWFDWLWPDSALKDPIKATPAVASLSENELRVWLREEDEPSFASLLKNRLEGVRSLGTRYADEFWDESGGRVPRTPLYAGFRAIITKPKENLPLSNEALYTFINNLEPREPYNDMQVRLVSQRLGGDLAGHEMLAAVAEGNHWQWALVSGDVPPAVMPRKMSVGIPHAELLLAYYTAFAEVGLLGEPAQDE